MHVVLSQQSLISHVFISTPSHTARLARSQLSEVERLGSAAAALLKGIVFIATLMAFHILFRVGRASMADALQSRNTKTELGAAACTIPWA